MSRPCAPRRSASTASSATAPARFNIEDNPEADPGPAFWEFPSLGESSVDRYDDTIERAAKRRGIDPDLIRSVMWAENARGHYGGLNQILDMIGSSRTKLPINIRPYWAQLVDARAEDMTKPEINIEASAELLRRIRDRIDRPTPAKIGTIWNFTGEDVVSDFGAAIARIYSAKPWLRRRGDAVEPGIQLSAP
jgi:hypothetical protein